MKEIKILREKLVERILSKNTRNLKENETEQLVNFYGEKYDELVSHQDKNNLLNYDGQNQSLNNQRDEMVNELTYYNTFIEYYKRAHDVPSNTEFFTDLKELNMNTFGEDIDIKMCIKDSDSKPVIDYVDDNNFNDSIEALREELDKKNNEIKVAQNYQPDYPDINKNDYEDVKKQNYDYDLDIKDDYKYKIEESPKDDGKKEIVLETNRKLTDSVRNLEKQKKELADRLAVLGRQSERKSQTRLSANRTSQMPPRDYKNEGFYQILRKKDEQITDIQMKINRLEKEKKRQNDDSVDKDLLISKNKTERAERKSKYRSRSIISKNDYREKAKVSDAPLRRNKYDNSGTDFVGQMRNNIDRLLNKSNARQTPRLNYNY